MLRNDTNSPLVALRLRVWLPLVAVLITLITIATVLLSGLPVAGARLAEYSEQRALTRATAAAEAVEGLERGELGSELGAIARTAGGWIAVVDVSGQVVARAGAASPPPLSDEILDSATAGDRMVRQLGDRSVAIVPLLRNGTFEGGVVFVPADTEATVFRLFSRSVLEAAVAATVLGGGLMLLVATLLSRRVERLTLGTRALEGGDLSARIEPGYGDEIGELAHSFNSMSASLESHVARIEEERKTRDAILGSLTEGVLATNLKGEVLFANPAARVMSGLGEAELPTSPPAPWREFDLPSAVVRCARDREREEARVKGRDTFLMVKLEPVPAFDGQRGGVLIVIQDLSESRRLEANQQRFLANAAHELKTPITTILGTAELIQSEERDDPGFRERSIERILAEAERMQRLSQTLLKLTTTGTDVREPWPEPLDLGDVVREAVAGMEPLSQRAGVRLSVEGSGATLHADKEWLEQALLAVISNAVKYSEGGGRVRVHVRGAAVTVEDEGEGISESELPFVFERFHRSGSQGGFGLGLPICKDLVERMGGEVFISSTEGVGTNVTIELREDGVGG